MKTLLILRHAKSSWGNPDLSDHDRPLNARGKDDAPRMGELLREKDLVPDLIISSTAKRAHTTAKLVAETCGYEGEIILTRDFYHADSETYFEGLWAHAEKEEVVMVVGHNPGMEALIYELTNESVRFSTANIANVQLAVDSWDEVGDGTAGKLLDVWRPKEI